MKIKYLCLLLSLFGFTHIIEAQYIPKVNTWYRDTSDHVRPWQSAATIIGTNLSVWSFDKYAVKADFAQISRESIRENFRKGFVWDNDMFLTNLFMHPYHGNLYYNAARSNGLNYWQSMPFTLGGSLMWEMCMETEPPSINDIFTTTFGGMALGEINHRLSTAIVDESAHGWGRAGMEFAGFLLAPTAGITRLINGSMFQHKPRGYRHNYPKLPLYIQAGVGSSFNAEELNLFKGIFSQTIDIQLQYNDPFDIEDCKPFDFFKLSTTLKLFSNQPKISKVNASALLWGRNYTPFKNHKMLIGVFQNFDYFDSDTLFANSTHIPYKVSAAASFGGGLLYAAKNENNTIDMNLGLHVNAILMGGSLTDYYRILNRNYNLGSGLASKAYSEIRFSKVGAFYLGVDIYHLFTWKGYEPGSIDPKTVTAHNFNAQGDKGFSNLIIINPRMEFYVSKQISVNTDIYAHLRNTHYTYYDDIRYNTFEVKTSIVYKY